MIPCTIALFVTRGARKLWLPYVSINGNTDFLPLSQGPRSSSARSDPLYWLTKASGREVGRMCLGRPLGT